MMPLLPEPLEGLVRPVFLALPLHRMLGVLVVERPPTDRHIQLIEPIVSDPILRGKPELVAGLWLYIDALEPSHRVSQSIDTPTGAFWHAIMHRREGDFSNAKYWYRRAGSHPVMDRIDTSGGSAGAGTDVGRYDPFDFVDHVARAQRERDPAPELAALQRSEWASLFEYCAEH
jgi:hypothetical protein